MVKWVFFDLDNVIFNDEPCFAMIFQKLYEKLKELGHEVTFDQLMLERSELIDNQQEGKIHQLIAKKYLKKKFDEFFKSCMQEITDNFLYYNPLMPGIEHQIKDLAKNYSLGICANHIKRARQALENLNLINYFDVIAISEEMHISKPAAEFFALTLFQKQVTPRDAVMIGDRLDFDILPASKMGMKTVWLNIKPEQKFFNPRNDFEKSYVQNLKTSGFQNEVYDGDIPKADVTISSISQISYAIRKLSSD